MPRPASSSSTPSLLPSALPKIPSQESTTTELPPSAIFAGKGTPHTGTCATSTSAALNASAAPDVADSATPPPFTPFFTLITNAHSTTTHHPSVHYIFSDDDSDLITDAALRIHDRQSTSSSNPHPHPRSSTARQTSAESSAQTSGKDAGVVGIGGAKDEGVIERYIVVELAENGVDMRGASSLTGDWAVLGTSVGKAPTLEGGGGEEGEKGLLLRIEGCKGFWGEVEDKEGERGKGGEGERRLEELVEVFGRRMGELRGVVEGGGI